jgi:hypothetical protein
MMLPSQLMTAMTTVREALRRIVAASIPGDVVSIPQLRRSITMSKAAFDAAVIALLEADEVVVHMHDLPAALPPAERDALVRHPDGTYFCAITFRRRK